MKETSIKLFTTTARITNKTWTSDGIKFCGSIYHQTCVLYDVNILYIARVVTGSSAVHFSRLMNVRDCCCCSIVFTWNVREQIKLISE